MHSGCRRIKTETLHLITCLKNSLFLVGSKKLFTATSIFQLLLVLPSEALNPKLTFPTLLLCLSCFSLELHNLNRATALLTLPWLGKLFLPAFLCLGTAGAVSAGCCFWV